MLAMLQYQTSVVRGDFDTANELLQMIPESEYLTVARFLEAQGFKEEAMTVTTDADHKFDLACELGELDIALEIMGEVDEEDAETTDTQAKWKKLSDLALNKGNFELAVSASKSSKDYSGLLLIYSSMGDKESMKELAETSRSGGRFNVAFLAYFMLSDVETCVELLKETSRLPEAAFFARTYLPSKVEEIVGEWKTGLASVSETAAKSLASPAVNPEHFPDFDVALKVEQMFLANRGSDISAGKYQEAKGDLEMDLIEMVKSGGGAAPPEPPPEQAAPKSPEPVAPPSPPEDNDEVERVGEAKAAEEGKLALEKAAGEMKMKEEERKRKEEEEKIKKKAKEKAEKKKAEEEAAAAAAAAKKAEEEEAKEAARKAEEEAAAAKKAEEKKKEEAKKKEEEEDKALGDEFTDDW